MLHGFPEFWYGWRAQIPALVSAGFRLMIPDQIGYNRSSRPETIADAGLDPLADDVIALIEAAGEERAYVVGHDWGGAVAWWLANRDPERVARMVILNVAHHAAMARAIRTSWRQRVRSSYIAFFQLPRLPELWLARANFAPLAAMMRLSARRGTFSDGEMAAYRDAWRQPGALAGMLAWYRALRVARPGRLASPRITVPTLIIWGLRDAAFEPSLAWESLSLTDDGELETFPDATHWVQHEESARVNDLLVDFLSR